MPPAIVVGLAGAAIGVVVVMLGLPADLFGRVPPVAGTIRVPAQSVAVIDGQTLMLRDIVVHLQGVAAPERDDGGACMTNGTDCGTAAASALASLVRGQNIACKLDGRDPRGFVRGTCQTDGGSVNGMLVADGWARNRGPFGTEETAAKAADRGLWRDGAFGNGVKP